MKNLIKSLIVISIFFVLSGCVSHSSKFDMNDINSVSITKDKYTKDIRTESKSVGVEGMWGQGWSYQLLSVGDVTSLRVVINYRSTDGLRNYTSAFTEDQELKMKVLSSGVESCVNSEIGGCEFQEQILVSVNKDMKYLEFEFDKDGAAYRLTGIQRQPALTIAFRDKYGLYREFSVPKSYFDTHYKAIANAKAL